MNFVLDSSLALAFVLEDESTSQTDEVLERLGRGAVAWVPALWRWEVANALLMSARRGRISSAEVHRHLSHLQSLPIEIDPLAAEESWRGARSLAERRKLTVYDAAYLEAAIRLGLPLGSLDTDLRSAAKTEKVSLLPAKVGT